MKTFDVSVEVIRAYVVQVKAKDAATAASKVEDMTPADIESKGDYIDTHVVADDESEESE